MRVRCWVLGLWVVVLWCCGVVVLLFVSSVCSREKLVVEKRKNEQIGAPS